MSTAWVEQGNSLELLRAMPDDCIDLVITDPPYASLEKHRAVGTTTRLTKEWFPCIADDELVAWFVELHRVLKPGRHLYVLCDPETSYSMLPRLRDIGWQWGNRLIWDKILVGMGYHYRRSYEDVLFLWKGPKGQKRKVADLGIRDVIQVRAVRSKDAYPTEKPPELARILASQSGLPGEVCLDPFCGSGALLEGAQAAGMAVVGFDQGDRAVELARARLG
jgi:site-specific DNA-methyltransferase (adenine-specific)